MLKDPMNIAGDSAKNTDGEPLYADIEQTIRTKKSDGKKFKTGKKNYDPVQQYMAEIRNHGLISRDQERELARRIQEHGDDEAAYQMVVANLRLVVKIALKFQRFWNRNLLDLIQEGNVGLMQAVRKYDPERNVKFSYYASFWIKAYILKYMQDNWRMVKVVTTEGQRKLFYRLKQERRKLASMGIDPDSRQLSEQCGVEEKDVVDMEQRLQNKDISLDAPLNEDSDTDWVDFLRVDDDKSVEERFADREVDGVVNNKVYEFRSNIPHREREILDLRIYSETPMTLQSLGDRLSLSRERVRQLEKQIVDDLKLYLSREIHDFDEFAGYARSA
ncbi:MAG: sigma-70 family RNA polymerase sigma factor [Desulfobacteraceae bacterium]|nr:sigma-70 family RNA polymerase sigma factor [Desulfobacteraceae bacterium]